ncbi:MAG: IS6120 family transposase [uncultured Rubrobacteraceae bacterium]|uniref:Mutator family transposase n=1 Tax=uncultured Rubrobacteraceae bacterium TaxID=349277 RepID=A0A6J4QTV3_9ACTN|nr:MAG: IS6120 family transposase [uncultured Rubrobacteraceae bacterium]
MHRVHQAEKLREELMLDLDEIARQGARRMLAEALEAEVEFYIEAARGERDERGHALVVRNGYAREREILLGAGAVELKAPRVNDRRVDEDGDRQRFKSVIVPPYMRRSQKVSELLPLLYLHGLSSGDFIPALEEFFGSEASLSASTITRLTERWQSERESFMSRDLSRRDYVYVWVDGIHTGVRLGRDERLCSLVMVGARLDGAKELVAISDGYRESEASWAEFLRDLKKRGMRAPVLAVGDGALGFWAAVRDVFPTTRHQRDWVHKTRNVLDSLPKSVQRRAKGAIREISCAENKIEASKAIEAFASEFGAKWPKAVSKIASEKEQLLAFYDYPAEHWRHLRTTNPIESTFAPVRARTDLTKGPGSREAGLAMIYKLLEAAEGRWRKLTGSQVVALVRAGARFVNGELVEGSEENEEKDAA